MKNTRPLLCFVAGLCAIGLFACNKSQSPATLAQPNASASATAPAQNLPPDKVVATYDGKKITAGQLESKIKDQLEHLRTEYEQNRQELMRQSLQQMALEDIVEQEASDKGLTEQEYIHQQIDEKVPPPSDAEVQKFYESIKGRLPPGVTEAQIKPKIVEHLEGPARQKQASAFFDSLKKKHHLKIDLPRTRKHVVAKGPSRGPKNAKVTIVEFSDFQCPFCGRAYGTVEKLMKDYEGKGVRLVYEQFPLTSIHQHAEKAAEASLCAEAQGKFWPMYHQLFQNQHALEISDLEGYAKAIGLDTQKFDQCLSSGAKADEVASYKKAGEALGVESTPTFFINGIEISGAQPYSKFSELIDDELVSSK